MKKILTCLLLALLIGCNIFFSACSLVTINNQKYLAQVVAEAEGVKITMEDLIQGYNSFGTNYVQNQGFSTKEAVKQTIEDLINRELLYNNAKVILTEELVNAGLSEANGEIKNGLTLTEQNEVWKEVYDYINSVIKEYADEIIASEGLVVPSDEETDKEEEVTKFTPYTKKVEKQEDNSYKRIYQTRIEKNTDTELIEFTLNEYGIEGLAKRAYSKYISKTKKSREEYKNLTNEEVFEKECERIYKVYEKNKCLTLFQTKYENEMQIDLDAIREKYIELVRNSAFTYYLNESDYNSKMQSSANEVYYQPFGEKYISVAHILLKYSDEQTAKIEELKNDLNSGLIDIEEYNQQLTKIASQITVKDRLNENASLKTVGEVYSEVTDRLNACGTDNDLRVKTFIELIEKYNQDDGMLTSLNSQTQYYAINLDTEVKDTMVKPFADASRALYTEDGSSDFTVYAEPVLSEYGYHIIFSLGTVKNDINLSNIENVTINYLYETEAMKGTNKSLFDKMLEIIDESEYGEYQVSLILGLRENLTIKYNKTAYERLYK